MVQLQILNKILKSRSMDIVLANNITTDYFDQYPEEFEFISSHFRQYGNVPDIPTVLDNFNEFEVIDVTESDTYLIDKIHEEYQYRELVPIIKHAAEMTKTDSVAAVDYLKSALSNVSVMSGQYGVDIIADAKIRYDEYVEKRDSDKPYMIPTGFKEFDEATGGLMPKEELMIIFARTGGGKSWTLAKMLEHINKMNYNVGMFSPEMSATSMGYRFDTLRGHFSNFNLGRGRNVDNYEEHIQSLINNPKTVFRVIEPAQFGNRVTVSVLRRFCIQNNIQVLGIDGLQYLTDERYRRGDNKSTSLGNLSQDLFLLSRELGIPIIAVVQANRSGVDDNGGVPSLESIRDSDAIAYNATTIVSLLHKNRKLKMEIVKARNCEVGLKLCYDWDVDRGIYSFVENPDDGEEEQPVESNFTRNSQQRQQRDVEIDQPLTRQVTKPLPF